MTLKALASLARLCFNPIPSARISAVWIAKRASRILANFSASAQMSVEPDGDLLTVTINGRPFAWPHLAPPEELLRIASELYVPDHPHQYLWGKTRVAPGDVVLDVGSCEGGFSALVAEQGARPVAIEPSRHMHHVIRRLFELRNLPEPTIVGDAASDAMGSGFFVDDGVDVQSSRLLANHEAGGRPGYPVRIRTLDEIVAELKLPRVDFIKCDAEGADVRILRGAVETLKRFRPKIAFCIYHHPAHFQEMRAMLKPLGYKMKGKGLINQRDRFIGVLLHGW